MENHVYKKIEITGSSEQGMQDAIENAVAQVSKSIRNMRWLELVNVRGHFEDNKIKHWQSTVKIGFDVEE
ncbi:MAG: hypothetical protein GF398_19120 [Chitinivibrionales bacterium]|nr:hypothetical protein [Chitinivibrionales bacterium]